MTTIDELYDQLISLDRQSYRSYKQIRGDYQGQGFWLSVDAVQGDPFAAPSRCHAVVAAKSARLPPALYATDARRLGLEDYLSRQFCRRSHSLSQSRGMGSSGRIEMAQPSQAALERTTVLIGENGDIEARFTVGLPAQGRRILGRQAAQMLCEDVPEILRTALCVEALDGEAVQAHVETVEDGEWLRSQLKVHYLVSFIPDGSTLARRSGIDERPLETSIPFQSPESLRVSFDLPNAGPISGLGIPEGITLIVGGGYHGKSTLLHAIEQGIYSHIPGDGREGVATLASAVKVRAEDGRSVAGVNLSPFINHLPLGQSTEQFSTPNASGSTSQAASILEALEAGSELLLIDEDTSATNFMIRDRRMQALIAKDHEPITPFVDKVRQLYDEKGVSTIIVMGGSGDYFEAADRVIAMEQFLPKDVTEKAKAIAQSYATDRLAEGGDCFGEVTARRLTLNTKPNPRGRDGQEKRARSKTRGLDTIVINKEEIDVSALEQLVEPGQLKAIAAALLMLRNEGLKGTVAEVLDRVETLVGQEDLDGLTAFPEGHLAQFRRQDLAAALNRWRSVGD